MGIAERLGKWLDHFFARKETEANVQIAVNALTEELGHAAKQHLELSDRVKFLEALATDKKSDEIILKMRDELNGIKAMMRLTGTRTSGNPNPPPKFDGSEPWKR